MTGFDEYLVSVPASARFDSMGPIDAGDACSFVEESEPSDDPRVFRVQAGRCRLVLGSGWNANFVLDPESADFAIRTSVEDGSVVGTPDPRVFRTSDAELQAFTAWVVDTSENPPLELTLSNPGGDCVLSQGRLQVMRPDSGDATCSVDVERPMMTGHRLRLTGRGTVEVQPGPDRAGQILDCELDEGVVCTDRATSNQVAHPIEYASPTTVTVRSAASVTFSGACETTDDRQSTFEVQDMSTCTVVPVMSSEDGTVEIGFTEAGGSVLLSVPGGAEADRCEYVASASAPGCMLSSLPRVLEVQAVPDSPYTEFVGFSPGVEDGTEKFGCAATAQDTFTVDLSTVEPGVPPGQLTYTCDAEFACTAQAALEQVELAVADEVGNETPVAFDLTTATTTECPFQTDSFWRCVGQIQAAQLPDPFTLLTRATSKAAARLPSEFVAGNDAVNVGTLTAASGVTLIQATVNHCGVRYAFEIQVQ